MRECPVQDRRASETYTLGVQVEELFEACSSGRIKTGVTTTSDGMISVHLDPDGADSYIDAKPGHKPRAMAELIKALEVIGLEPLDEDEYAPELLEDGTIRIYCALIDGIGHTTWSACA